MTPQDALALSLIRGGTGERRHLVVCHATGQLDWFAIRPGALQSIASRFDGVLHVVLFGRDDEVLRRAAEVTGGEAHRGGSPDRLVETVGRILEEFRASYVLRYELLGTTPRDGWHPIEVRVVRPPGNRYTVRARTGYWWEDR